MGKCAVFHKKKDKQDCEKETQFSVYVVNPHTIPHIYFVIQD